MTERAVEDDVVGQDRPERREISGFQALKYVAATCPASSVMVSPSPPGHCYGCACFRRN
jgi:hypothetical protein